MKPTDTHRPTRTGLERHLGQCHAAPREDVSNIIPFPGARGSRRQPGQSGPRNFTSLLDQALRQARDRLRRLTGRPNRASLQPHPGAGTAPAARYPGTPDAKRAGHDGQPVRKRVSA